MSTSPVKTPSDEQLDDIESNLVMQGYGLPFNEVIGQPRERSTAVHLHRRLANHECTGIQSARHGVVVA